MFEHVGARTRWCDNISACFFEYPDRMFRNRAGFGTQARVEIWLSAAGLVDRKVHAHAKAAENVHNRLTSLWVERIDQAGDEELNGSHEAILTRIYFL